MLSAKKLVLNKIVRGPLTSLVIVFFSSVAGPRRSFTVLTAEPGLAGSISSELQATRFTSSEARSTSPSTSQRFSPDTNRRHRYRRRLRSRRQMSRRRRRRRHLLQVDGDEATELARPRPRERKKTFSKKCCHRNQRLNKSFL